MRAPRARGFGICRKSIGLRSAPRQEVTQQVSETLKLSQLLWLKAGTNRKFNVRRDFDAVPSPFPDSAWNRLRPGDSLQELHGLFNGGLLIAFRRETAKR